MPDVVLEYTVHNVLSDICSNPSIRYYPLTILTSTVSIAW